MWRCWIGTSGTCVNWTSSSTSTRCVVRPSTRHATRRAQAYYILDEIFVGGELCESSKKEVLSVCAQMDELMGEGEEDKAASGSSGRVRK